MIIEMQHDKESDAGNTYTHKRYPKVSIVILNWNGWGDTIECLESVYQMNYPYYDVIVVDNASSDDSIQRIIDWANGKLGVKSFLLTYNPTNKPLEYVEYNEDEIQRKNWLKKTIKSRNNVLTIIKNKKNYGFSKANNIAIKYLLESTNSEYILLLNNDVVVANNFLITLIKDTEKRKDCGIAGPKIFYYSKNRDILWFAGGKINKWHPQIYRHIGMKERDSEKYNKIRYVDWVSGAAMLLKVETIKKVGMLDESYSFGFEDVDYCLKAKKDGVKIIYIPNAIIWHKVGASRKKNENLNEKLEIIKRHYNEYLNKLIKNNFSIFFYIYHTLLFFVLSIYILFKSRNGI